MRLHASACILQGTRGPRRGQCSHRWVKHVVRLRSRQASCLSLCNVCCSVAISTSSPSSSLRRLERLKYCMAAAAGDDEGKGEYGASIYYVYTDGEGGKKISQIGVQTVKKFCGQRGVVVKMSQNFVDVIYRKPLSQTIECRRPSVCRSKRPPYVMVQQHAQLP